MFPRLDVDFHLAPFVDPRDHVGVAAARVAIGAPHFEKPREFWVRPVRWTGAEKVEHYFVVRPIEAAENQLFLARKVAIYPHDLDGTDLPLSWGKGVIDGPKIKVKSRLNNLLRYWRHPTLPLAASYSFYFGQDQNQFAPSLHSLTGSDAREFLWPTEFGEPLKFSSDQWLDWSAQDFHAFVAHQFDDSQSEIYLTWQWIQIPQEEWFATYVGRPEWSGFIELMRLVLINEFSHNENLSRQELKVQWNFALRRLQTNKALNWVNGMMALRNSAQNSFEYSQRLNIWSQAIRNHYDGLATQMPAPKSVNSHILRCHPISCSPPTHHEMLEARLQLHAWARENLPPSRAGELIALDDLN